jgi:hypothetical protein
VAAGPRRRASRQGAFHSDAKASGLKLTVPVATLAAARPRPLVLPLLAAVSALSQLRSSAGQAISVWSCAQPGRSAHSPRTQRPRGVVRTSASVAGGGGVCTEGGISSGGSGAGGVLPQPASVPRIAATAMAPSRRDKGNKDIKDMTLIILEALGAGLLLVGIVWWTMFSGRRGGERIEDDQDRGSDRRL